MGGEGLPQKLSAAVPSQSLYRSVTLGNKERSPAHLQAVLEGSPIGANFICILQNSVIQDQGFAPLLHQHIGLSNEKTPEGKEPQHSEATVA